ncbi:hypothetical protein C0585_05040 [Candidatus Woesearchaeota archaeon]|nr:MAG: hypothetical protein C0585_05040 [Candidatus Woesearchaeota archaeon]
MTSKFKESDLSNGSHELNPDFSRWLQHHMLSKTTNSGKLNHEEAVKTVYEIIKKVPREEENDNYLADVVLEIWSTYGRCDVCDSKTEKYISGSKRLLPLISTLNKVENGFNISIYELFSIKKEEKEFSLEESIPLCDIEIGKDTYSLEMRLLPFNMLKKHKPKFEKIHSAMIYSADKVPCNEIRKVAYK